MKKNKNRRHIAEHRPNPESQTINPWLSLAQNIVYQAILDWRRIDAGIKVPCENHASLLRFFNSKWCDTLLLYSGVSPERIIETLKAESEEANT